MRFIQRNPARTPELFQDGEFRQRLKELLRANSEGEQIRGDVYSLLDLVRSETINEVQDQFSRKCAYCETSVPHFEAHVDLFRPPFGAERANGRIDQSHYIWLIGEWENLYLCCQECRNLKRNLFPVNISSKFGKSINQLRREREAQLLDPCWDHPERYFEINSEGRFHSKKIRGKLTIDLLSLNRDSLCVARVKAMCNFFDVWNEQINRLSQLSTKNFRPLYEVFDGNAPFVGSIYLFLWQMANATTRKTLRIVIDTGPSDTTIKYLLKVFGPLSIDQAPPEFNNVQINLSDAGRWELAFRPIRSVLIENFKGVGYLEIDVPRFSDQSFAIVGENSTGKTSVLQAIALALAGPVEANRLIKDARIVLTEGSSDGRIELRFHEAREINEITFSNKSSRFQGRAARSVRVFGYGPYRLLAKRELALKKRGQTVRLTSLFDDGSKLNGYHGWLHTLNERQRQDLAEVLQLLLVSRETRVSVDVTTLSIRTNGKEHPIQTLSSGMQSVVSMCTDLMEALYSAGDSVLSDGYIILIDELDAHLHPAWRLGILQRLQRAFPNAQVIFSTHDPLTLRGMKTGQIHVLARDEKGFVRDAPAFYSDAQSVDQILTSPLFGLFSTHTREWERKYDTYIDLMLKDDHDGLSDSERVQLSVLTQELGPTRILGDTPRERLMYAVIDKFLAMRPRQAINWDDSVVSELAATIQSGINTAQ